MVQIGQRWKRRIIAQNDDPWNRVEVVGVFEQPEVNEFVVRQAYGIATVSVRAADLQASFSLEADAPPTTKAELGVNSDGEWVS